jgi:hypothetical protein
MTAGFVKVVGDGCFAAFDDPRCAVGYARDLCEQRELSLRAAVGAGLVEIIQGELVSPVLRQVASQVRRIDAGTFWVAPMVTELLAGHDLPNPTLAAALRVRQTMGR